jgi:hypothetical protein
VASGIGYFTCAKPAKARAAYERACSPIRTTRGIMNAINFKTPGVNPNDGCVNLKTP